MSSSFLVRLAMGLMIGISVPHAQTPPPAPKPAAAAAPTTSAENGKRLYTTYYCYACHGTVGQGGSAGSRLVPDPPGPPRIRYVRNPTGLMPAYTSKVISDRDLADIFAYLRAIPPSPPPGRIPLLNQ